MVPEFNGCNFSLDTYGNTELSEVMKIVFTKEIKESINWESFLYQKLPDVSQ